jgi:hypothetical protein
MTLEKREFQITFLKPPIHGMENLVSFSLPEATTPKQKLWEKLDPTPLQVADIELKSRLLGIPVPHVTNRRVARDMQFRLRLALNLVKSKRK